MEAAIKISKIGLFVSLETVVHCAVRFQSN